MAGLVRGEEGTVSAEVIPAERLEQKRRERERRRRERQAFAGSILEALTSDIEQRVASEPKETSR